MNKKQLGTLIAGLLVVVILISMGLAAFGAWLDRVTYEPAIARTSADLGWVRKESVTLTASGAAGAATGTGATDRDLNGYIYAIHLDYTAGISSTTDITISAAVPALTVLTRADTVTDGWFYPTIQHSNSAGTGITSYEKPIVIDALDITAAQTTTGTVATITILWGQ